MPYASGPERESRSPSDAPASARGALPNDLRPHEELATHGERHPAAAATRSSMATVMVVVIGIASGLVALYASDDGVDVALPLTAAGVAVLAYLASAVSGVRRLSWLWVALAAAVVVGAGLIGIPRWIVLVLAGVVLAAVGFFRHRHETLRQATVAALYLAVGALVVLIDPRLGLAIAGVTFAAHAAWDYVHVRRDAVVSRSLALWCMGLDVTIGVGCVVAAVVA